MAISFLKILKHRLLIIFWTLSRKTTALDFYGEAVSSMSGRWHGEIGPITTYHALFDVLRQRHFSGSFFELGGGYSTIIASTLFDDSDVAITSVDFYPAKYLRILNSRGSSRRFLGSIKSVNKITVSFEEVERALVTMVDRLMAFEQHDVLFNLSKFINDAATFEMISKYFRDGDSEAVCRAIREHKGFVDELDFYSEFGAMNGVGFCSEIADSGVEVDAVFFDCGEASSVAEFLALERCFKRGSYVLLHDIYFPKSIKNFLLATLLMLDSSWDILYCDAVSEQGGLVAVKL